MVESLAYWTGNIVYIIFGHNAWIDEFVLNMILQFYTQMSENLNNL